jgi:ABC-2 type transport system permease protein
MLNFTHLMPTRRAMLIAKRDYVTSIRSKAFLIGLIIFPILFGGGIIGIAAMKAKPDLRDRHVALMDRTGKLAQFIVDAAARRNATDTIEPKTGVQASPRYLIEPVAVESGDPNQQRLALCERIRRGEVFGFLEVGPDALHPPDLNGGKALEKGQAGFYSNAGKIDRAESWLNAVLNDGIRAARLAELGIDPAKAPLLMKGVDVDTMTLVARDPKTGTIQTPVKEDEMAAFAVPFAAMMLLAMVVMIGAAPMMTGVTEDKSQRIVEMLLGIATPFDLMAGKVMAGVGRSLTSSLLYVSGATVVLLGMNVVGIAPLTLLPWFYAYLLAEVTLLCALAAGLGAACSTPQEAGNLVMIVMGPIIIPMFTIVPVANKPNGAFATAMSLFPPFTPLIMMLRQTMPGGVPAWQPWVGLGGTIVFAVLGIWVASRIFRVAILMQGQPLRLKSLVTWAVKG